MTFAGTALLGALAGFTIFLGLPVGRLQLLGTRARVALAMFSVGILVFLLWDVLSHAIEPLEGALVAASVEHTGSWLRFGGLALTFVACLGAGLLSLVYYERWMAGRRKPAPLGPGAARVEEFEPQTLLASPTRRLALFIAAGIGLHNFSEGLAIGQSAAAGEVSLALLLIIGFGLHNATEGFGIVAPMAGDAELPSWRVLGVLGLIGGGPTFLGTVVGQSFVNDTIFLGFLALAAGSILYVVIQLLHVASRLGQKELLMWGGEDWARVYDDGAAYDPAADSWRPLPAAGLSPRIGTAQVWTGRELLVWGGTPGTFNNYFADGAAYTPDGDRWRRLPNWTGRFVASNVWTGREMIVWGGIVPTGAAGKTVEIKSVADGRRYLP